MRSLILILSLILLITAIAFAQPDTLWTKVYGDSDICEECNSVQQTFDGGYILAGFKLVDYIFPNEYYDMYVVKTDSIGDTLWTRTYGGAETEIAYSVQQTSDGGFVIAGYTESYGAGSRDFYLVRTDENGDTLWTRTYGGYENETCYSMIIADDGNYILAGSTNSFGTGQNDMFLMKVDTLGNLDWQWTYGDTLFDCCCTVQQDPIGGGYILAGQSDTDIYLVTTDEEGIEEWDWTIDLGSDTDCCNSLIISEDDSTYILGGITDATYYDGLDIFVLKLNLLWGFIEWVQIYNSGPYSSDEGKSVIQTNDGDFILGGKSEIGYCRTSFHSKIIKTNELGYQEWEYFSGNYMDPPQACNSIIQTDDGGYAFAGWCGVGPGSAWHDMYLVKFAPEGQSFLNEETTNQPNIFALNPPYPNPFNASTVISYQLQTAGDLTLSVYDVIGQEVAKLVDEYKSAGTHNITFDAKDLVSGVYFIRLTVDSGQSMVQKVVLMK